MVDRVALLAESETGHDTRRSSRLTRVHADDRDPDERALGRAPL